MAKVNEVDLLPFTDVDYIANPYPYYAHARALTPVYKNPGNVYIVTRHGHVSHLLRHPRLSAREVRFGVADVFHDTMLGQDPPRHTQLRRISAKWFTPRAVVQWRGVMHSLVEKAIDEAQLHGGLDFVEDLAFPATFGTMAHILGVGTQDARAFAQKTYEIGLALRPSPTPIEISRAENAFRWYGDCIRELVKHKTRRPGNGMLDALIASCQDDIMSAEEVVATTTLFYTVGHQDNTYLIANGLLQLSRIPDAAAQFRDRPAIRKPAVDELLRLDTPTQYVTRSALDPIEIDDLIIPAGSIVILLLGSANHDDDVFPNPHIYDPARPNLQQHVVFGGGSHGCVGASLARAQGEIAIGTFLERFPAFQIGPDIQYGHTDFLRMIVNMPVHIR
jgi:cytochrome P450